MPPATAAGNGSSSSSSRSVASSCGQWPTPSSSSTRVSGSASSTIRAPGVRDHAVARAPHEQHRALTRSKSNGGVSSSGSSRRPESSSAATRARLAWCAANEATTARLGGARAGERRAGGRSRRPSRAATAGAIGSGSRAACRTIGSRSMIVEPARHLEPGGRDRHDAGERQVGPLGEPQRGHAAERVADDHHVPVARRTARRARPRTRRAAGSIMPSPSGDAVPEAGQVDGDRAAVARAQLGQQRPPGVGASRPSRAGARARDRCPRARARASRSPPNRSGARTAAACQGDYPAAAGGSRGRRSPAGAVSTAASAAPHEGDDRGVDQDVR